jgi:hypothetical protein
MLSAKLLTNIIGQNILLQKSTKEYFSFHRNTTSIQQESELDRLYVLCDSHRYSVVVSNDVRRHIVSNVAGHDGYF